MSEKSEIKNITNADHDAHVYADHERIVVLDFYADWCGPCKAAMPQIEALAGERDVDVYKVDVDAEGDLAAEYGIRSIPHFAVLDLPAEEVYNFSSVADLRAKLDEMGVD